MTTRARLLALPLLVALGARATTAFAQGCAMCGSSFSPNDPATRAFTWSVIFLLAAPYVIFFTAAAVVVVLYRRGMLARRAPVIPLSARRRGALADGPKEVSP